MRILGRIYRVWRTYLGRVEFRCDFLTVRDKVRATRVTGFPVRTRSGVYPRKARVVQGNAAISKKRMAVIQAGRHITLKYVPPHVGNDRGIPYYCDVRPSLMSCSFRGYLEFRMPHKPVIWLIRATLCRRIGKVLQVVVVTKYTAPIERRNLLWWHFFHSAPATRNLRCLLVQTISPLVLGRVLYSRNSRVYIRSNVHVRVE